MSAVREPAVAGRFYPADAVVLHRELDSYLSHRKDPAPAITCVAPHAGYIYSGAVAGAVFSRLEIPRRCIVLCPNHTGRGHPLAILKSGGWKTPLGILPVCTSLAEELMAAFPALSEDAAAHRYEHAIEVELPFLQTLRPDIEFVPITVGIAQLLILEQLGNALAKVCHGHSSPPLLIASSDMNHYEDDATTRIKDGKAIEKILALDARGLHATVIDESISMCGFAPTVAVLTAAVKLGASKAELVQYATSADVSGDRQMVVGYAGIVIQ